MSITDISGYNVNMNTETSGVTAKTGDTENVNSRDAGQTSSYHGSGSAVPGDIISGKITTSDDGNISLTLSDNTELSAHVDGNIRLVPGETLSFQVKSSDENLVLVPIGTNTAMGASAEKALAAADLELSQSNMQMVTQMMHEGMNIDASSLRTMNRIVSEYPSVDMTEVIQLKNMNVDVTQENIGQLKNYKNAEYQIEKGASELSGLLTDEITGNIESGLADKAVQMYKDLFDIIQSGTGGGDSAALTGGTYSAESIYNTASQINAENSDVMQDLGGAIQNAGLHNDIQSGLGLNESVAESPIGDHMNSEQLIQTADILENAGFPQEITDSVKDGTISVKDFLDSVMQYIADNADIISGSGSTGTDTDTVIAGNTIANITMSDGKAADGVFISDSAADAGRSKTAVDIANTIVGTDTSKTADKSAAAKALELIEKALGGTEPGQEKAVTDDHIDKTQPLVRLLKSESVRNMIRDAILDNFQITPQETSDKENIKQLYERIIKQTDDIKNVLAKNSAIDSPAGDAVQNMRNNIEFMNQVNQTFSYVQLPVRLSDGNAHGDLYVYTNKKDLTRKDGTVTALLHLDMANLGPMDVYISMNTGDHVNTHFYLQDEESLDLIESHIDELDRHLSQRGYTVTAECSKRSEMTKASSEITGHSSIVPDDSRPISYTSFDARA